VVLKRFAIAGFAALAVVSLSSAANGAYDHSHGHQGRTEVRRGLRAASLESRHAVREAGRATSRASVNARSATRRAYRETRSAIGHAVHRTNRAIRDAFRWW
jgi:hypothetical protein